MVIQNGIRIAFLNYSYNTNGIPVKEPNVVNIIDTIQIVRDLKMTALYKPDIIIAQLHWGRSTTPNPHSSRKGLPNFSCDMVCRSS